MTIDHPEHEWDEHEWDDLDEAPPTPEEQAAAAQLATALAHKEPAQAIEDALSIAQLLQHQARPPTLAPARKDAIEAAFLQIFDQRQAAQMATPDATEQVQTTQVQATQMEAAIVPPSDGSSLAAPEQKPLAAAPDAAGWRGWMDRLAALFATGPRLAMGGAFVAIMALTSVLTITQTKQMAPPKTASTKSRAIPQQRWVVAQLSSSPWQPGQDPFAVTNTPDQRIERVLEHNSQQALESSLEAHSRFYVLR